jgi:predicted transposase YdaD
MIQNKPIERRERLLYSESKNIQLVNICAPAIVLKYTKPQQHLCEEMHTLDITGEQSKHLGSARPRIWRHRST